MQILIALKKNIPSFGVFIPLKYKIFQFFFFFHDEMLRNLCDIQYICRLSQAYFIYRAKCVVNNYI